MILPNLYVCFKHHALNVEGVPHAKYYLHIDLGYYKICIQTRQTWPGDENGGLSFKGVFFILGMLIIL